MDEETAKRVAIESARSMFMRPSERRAVSALERVVIDSERRGYLKGLLAVEQALLSSADEKEFFAWLAAQIRPGEDQAQ